MLILLNLSEELVLNLHRAWRQARAAELLAIVEVLSMRVKRVSTVLTVIICIFVLGVVASPSFSAKLNDIPVKGKVTMVDLGATKCIPCKMMAPILQKLEKRYAGKAAIVFLDVWVDPEPATHFRIRIIPTQIFFNKKGEEVYRHEGFMSEKEIVAVLQKLGVN
jgi:thioredoxin 1